MADLCEYSNPNTFDDDDDDDDTEFQLEDISVMGEKQSKTETEVKGSLMTLNTNKAGMQGLDVEKINEIIQKASEGSKFYLHKQKCQERIDAKIAQMKAEIERFSKEQIQRAEDKMTRIGEELEMEREFSRTIVHVDMDMFYAAVEMRDDPSLRDKPMAVGSNSMLSTSNYAARKFGVRAAMPGFIGKKLCPGLIIVPCNFDKYRQVSSVVQSVFEMYDPRFCPMSLDEAYLDITDYLHVNGHKYSDEGSSLTVAEAVVNELRKRIQEKTQLTASAGIACNTRLAKICSDMNKPDGQYYLPSDKEEILNFVKNLPIRKVSGIGNVSEQQLRSLGVVKCFDLWTHRGLLQLLFNESSATHFLHVALGLGSTQVSPATERERKSISNETTFAGTSDRNVLVRLCQDLCKDLKVDMVRKGLYGKVFTLKVKTTSFKVRTRAQTLIEYTQDENVMMAVGQKLLLNELDAEPKGTLSLRLIGVRMSNFIDKLQPNSKKQVTLTHLFNSIGNDCTSGSQVKIMDSVKESPKKKFITEHQATLIQDRSEPEASSSSVSLDTVHQEIFREGTDEKSCSSDQDSKSDTCNKNTESYTCPVCGKEKFTDINALNTHIDTCLNLEEVKKLVQETNSNFTSKPSTTLDKTSNLKDSKKKEFKSKRKLKNSSSKNNFSKRLKNDPKSGNTLHKYFSQE